ncbi:hypothetical protein DL766_001934 [Monosporascus sp. MC13-8B]|uniref:Uncharacterized protein n=1 Tax=Monosporascus cannonballus TaxID=155416 RepID=A0ABY0HKG7_9PEZI|nr:hypothetical protein DL762_000462 [Monosporascus cannonballus]RYO96155.1 hypothetical protein DL763_003356 [Monosporascus cannonballus]RYP36558.1 hypothetical protein DL766_001934 [Monosporascus sp. MC13-8B]
MSDTPTPHKRAASTAGTDDDAAQQPPAKQTRPAHDDDPSASRLASNSDSSARLGRVYIVTHSESYSVRGEERGGKQILGVYARFEDAAMRVEAEKEEVLENLGYEGSVDGYGDAKGKEGGSGDDEEDDGDDDVGGEEEDLPVYFYVDDEGCWSYLDGDTDVSYCCEVEEHEVVWPDDQTPVDAGVKEAKDGQAQT